METQKDFKELLELLNARSVEFVIVGGYALAFHGVPRYTGDLDILVKPDKTNAEKILKAMDDFGFGFMNFSLEDFSRPGKVTQLGFPPVRIDIITSITGVSWEDASTHAVAGTYGDVHVRYLGKEELIANKRALRRHKDLADLEALGEKA
ncbi:MAG TPA: nucleotidyl transferase AbiEii/AbiGii toxin family protein [Spirochaetota bacterium]|nr:nucleotidyl transferase AbiEii/AbiGii toxin family protein [Spirochaetota bacterium]OPZ39189.1 MAG: hypothetical protein BWY96_00429 [Spirochaetes bacterium ADurb.BinA120]HNU93115.1 nucleotidyl transferase AbiEii/AbiGii toxin family protein [Spirochaetota bacterium]HPI14673.1 nucleotidyl transferase AbiEii/AbiGii toxin family protein [Spirochaetota bacterium]HPO44411.1 nucleotidyl transferase AbiEii/AbiGii toxin family protein [Spirochaetota bacterium]